MDIITENRLRELGGLPLREQREANYRKINTTSLVDQYGSDVAWMENGKWIITFGSGDSTLGMQLADKYNRDPNIEFNVAYGDDEPDSIIIADVSKIPNDVYQYIEQHIGRSPYADD